MSQKNNFSLFQQAKNNLNNNETWIHSQTSHDASTFYRRETDGTLSIKIEGRLSGASLFEQICVLREIDLYSEWAPFCAKSRKLAQLGQIDVVGWFLIGLQRFHMTRDCCFRAVGCDSMKEDGSIIIIAEGLEDGQETPTLSGKEDDYDGDNSILTDRTDGSKYDVTASTASPVYAPYNRSYLSRDEVISTIDIPPPPKGYGHGRMILRKFDSIINVISPKECTTSIVANIDPNLRFIPQVFVDYVMRKICGVLLSKLQSAAKKCMANPVNSPHSRRMREDTGFYVGFLLPKFRSHCREKGWEMLSVAALEMGETDLNEEEWRLYSQSIQQQNKIDFVELNQEKVELESINFSSSSYCSSRSSLSSRSGISQRLSPSHKLKKLKQKRKKKRLDVIMEKKRDAERKLIPAPFSPEDLERLRNLRGLSSRSATSRLSQVTVIAMTTVVGKIGNLFRNSPIHLLFDTLSATRYESSNISTEKWLYILLSMMFFFFYTESFIVGKLFLSEKNGDDATNLSISALCHTVSLSVRQLFLTLSLMIIYSIMHALVVFILMLTAYDKIELPGNVGPRLRFFSTGWFKVGSMCFAGSIIVFSFGKAMFIFVRRSLVLCVLSTFAKMVEFSNDTVLMHFASTIYNAVYAAIGIPLNILSACLNGILSFFRLEWSLRILQKICTFGALFFNYLIGEATLRNHSTYTWHKYALNDAKSMATYSTVYLLILTIAAIYLCPKKIVNGKKENISLGDHHSEGTNYSDVNKSNDHLNHRQLFSIQEHELPIVESKEDGEVMSLPVHMHKNEGINNSATSSGSCTNLSKKKKKLFRRKKQK